MAAYQVEVVGQDAVGKAVLHKVDHVQDEAIQNGHAFLELVCHQQQHFHVVGSRSACGRRQKTDRERERERRAAVAARGRDTNTQLF